MAPRRTRVEVVEPDDADAPFREALRNDSENIAEQFSAIIEEFGGVADGSVRGHLYKVERTGKFQWIGEYWPPFDQAEIFKEMRERYNGGDYQLRIMVQGRRGVQKTVTFSVAPTPNGGPQAKDNSNTDLIMLMMNMQGQAADRQMQMMAAMNQQSQAMFAQMQQSQSALMAALIPAMIGSREKISDLVPLLRPEKSDSLKETLETLTVAKGLFSNGEGAGGIDPEDLVGSAIRLGGPLIGAIGKAVAGRPQDVAVTQLPPGYDTQTGAAPLMLPGAEPGIPVQAQASRFPVIDLIADDVLFFYRRAYDPQFAADAVYERIEQLGVTEEQINELVAAFIGSADPWGELAASGLDLRGNPQWAGEFLQSLIAIHSDAGSDDSERGTGGAADAGIDGAAGAGGLALTADTPAGG